MVQPEIKEGTKVAELNDSYIERKRNHVDYFIVGSFALVFSMLVLIDIVKFRIFWEPGQRLKKPLMHS